eukprot:gb/GECG01005771.1/.p1 GENE.gb/GECG01005771.1/~~gb/GECG01005771.1/.p1  ORF type:complete len:1024 (+),score=129.66 gb/GECG01005771.1/:1-3072(+)
MSLKESGSAIEEETRSETSSIVYNYNLVEPDKRGIMRRVFKRYGGDDTAETKSPLRQTKSHGNMDLQGNKVVTEMSFRQFMQLLQDMGVADTLKEKSTTVTHDEALENLLLLSKEVFNTLRVTHLGFDVFPTALSLAATELFPNANEKDARQKFMCQYILPLVSGRGDRSPTSSYSGSFPVHTPQDNLATSIGRQKDDIKVEEVEETALDEERTSASIHSSQQGERMSHRVPPSSAFLSPEKRQNSPMMSPGSRRLIKNTSLAGETQHESVERLSRRIGNRLSIHKHAAPAPWAHIRRSPSSQAPNNQRPAGHALYENATKQQAKKYARMQRELNEEKEMRSQSKVSAGSKKFLRRRIARDFCEQIVTLTTGGSTGDSQMEGFNDLISARNWWHVVISFGDLLLLLYRIGYVQSEWDQLCSVLLDLGGVAPENQSATSDESTSSQDINNLDQIQIDSALHRQNISEELESTYPRTVLDEARAVSSAWYHLLNWYSNKDESSKYGEESTSTLMILRPERHSILRTKVDDDSSGADGRCIVTVRLGRIVSLFSRLLTGQDISFSQLLGEWEEIGRECGLLDKEMEIDANDRVMLAARNFIFGFDFDNFSDETHPRYTPEQFGAKCRWPQKIVASLHSLYLARMYRDIRRGRPQLSNESSNDNAPLRISVSAAANKFRNLQDHRRRIQDEFQREQQRRQEEELAECTFQPQLNARDSENVDVSGSREPVFERLYAKPKNKEKEGKPIPVKKPEDVENESQCTFRPQLNHKYEMPKRSKKPKGWKQHLERQYQGRKSKQDMQIAEEIMSQGKNPASQKYVEPLNPSKTPDDSTASRAISRDTIERLAYSRGRESSSLASSRPAVERFISPRSTGNNVNRGNVFPPRSSERYDNFASKLADQLISPPKPLSSAISTFYRSLDFSKYKINDQEPGGLEDGSTSSDGADNYWQSEPSGGHTKENITESEPLVFIDIDIGGGKTERISVYENVSAATLARDFCVSHGLDPDVYEYRLATLIAEQRQQALNQ